MNSFKFLNGGLLATLLLFCGASWAQSPEIAEPQALEMTEEQAASEGFLDNSLLQSEDFDQLQRRRGDRNNYRRDWERRYPRRRIDRNPWRNFWGRILFPGISYYPPYPVVGRDYYHGPLPDYRRAPAPYRMVVTTGLNFRSSPNASGSANICGVLPAGMTVAVATLTAPSNSMVGWAVLRVDSGIRSYMRNPNCGRLQYVYVARRFLQ